MNRFQELSAFLAVVEAGGFSAAARRTGESQSAVSKAVGALEKRLGVMLLNRNTRSVTLTDQGQKYYDRMKPLLEQMHEADSELIGSKNKLSGLIRISAGSTFGRLLILPLIPELLAQNPGLQVDLILSDLPRDMVQDRIDLGIRIGRVEEPDAVVRRLGSTPLVCAGSRRYFERRGTPKTPSELVNHNCLLYSGLAEAAGWPFVGPQGRFSVPVKGNLSSNTVEATRAAVLAGVGIAMFTRISLADELQHPDIVTILDEFIADAKDVSLVWPKRKFVAARVRRATDYFAEALLRQM